MAKRPSYAELQANLERVSQERDRFAAVLTDVLARAGKGDALGSESISWIEIEGGHHIMRLYRPLGASGGVVVAAFHSSERRQKPVVSVHSLDDYYERLKDFATSGAEDAQALFEQVGKLRQVRGELIEQEIAVAAEARKGKSGGGRG